MRYLAIDPFAQSFDTHPDVAAVRIGGEEPKLTDEARKAKVHDIVILQVGIDDKGRPAGYYVVKPLPIRTDRSSDCGCPQLAIQTGHARRQTGAQHTERHAPILCMIATPPLRAPSPRLAGRRH